MVGCKVADNIICLLKFYRNCPFYLFYLTWKEQSAVKPAGLIDCRYISIPRSLAYQYVTFK